MKKKKLTFDKRRERDIIYNSKRSKRGMQFYIRNKNGIEKPVIVELPNIIALYLSISEKSFQKANKIFYKKLEPNIVLKRDYYEYDFKNNDKYVFDCVEEMIISIVFAYSAVEACVNNLIPNYCSFIKKENNRFVVDDKEYIEKKYSLSNKIKDVIPKLYNINLDFNKLELWESFVKLERFRNEIIHYKTDVIEKYESKQTGFITELIFEFLKNDISRTAFNLIKLLSDKIKLNPVLPYEFCSEPIDIKLLKEFCSRKNFFERFRSKINSYNIIINKNKSKNGQSQKKQS